MMEVDISVQMLGVLSSVVAFAFAYVPMLGDTDLKRALVAIAVLIAGVFIEQGMVVGSWEVFAQTFFGAALYALGTYKMFLQPIVQPTVTVVTEAVAARAKG